MRLCFHLFVVVVVVVAAAAAAAVVVVDFYFVLPALLFYIVGVDAWFPSCLFFCTLEIHGQLFIFKLYVNMQIYANILYIIIYIIILHPHICKYMDGCKYLTHV